MLGYYHTGRALKSDLLRIYIYTILTIISYQVNSSSFSPSPQSFPGFIPFESLFAWIKGCELISSSSLLCFVALRLFDVLFILCCQQILQKLSIDYLFFSSILSDGWKFCPTLASGNTEEEAHSLCTTQPCEQLML